MTPVLPVPQVCCIYLFSTITQFQRRGSKYRVVYISKPEILYVFIISVLFWNLALKKSQLENIKFSDIHNLFQSHMVYCWLYFLRVHIAPPHSAFWLDLIRFTFSDNNTLPEREEENSQGYFCTDLNTTPVLIYHRSLLNFRGSCFPYSSLGICYACILWRVEENHCNSHLFY